MKSLAITSGLWLFVDGKLYCDAAFERPMTSKSFRHMTFPLIPKVSRVWTLIERKLLSSFFFLFLKKKFRSCKCGVSQEHQLKNPIDISFIHLFRRGLLGCMPTIEVMRWVWCGWDNSHWIPQHITWFQSPFSLQNLTSSIYLRLG